MYFKELTTCACIQTTTYKLARRANHWFGYAKNIIDNFMIFFTYDLLTRVIT